jgi:UDP-2,4-diacetamido-2,4,6-trideoxy-beta-L-altropyranose hydrolase
LTIMPQAVIRADASEAIGGGHVVRCLALANGLADAGWSCRFAVSPGADRAVPALGASEHDIIELDGPASAEPAEIAQQCGAPIDLLIVDHYQRGAEFTTPCRSWARRVLVVDDLADRPYDANILLDQTFGRTEREYTSLVPEHCELLLGPTYALLRPSFGQLRPAALARRTGGLRRVLVSMGNSDPHDLTSLALRAIEESGIELEVDVVLGSRSPNRAGVESQVSRLGQSIRLHLDAPDMAELMVAADLAIGACGITSWERCTLGLPTIAVVAAENQRVVAGNLAAAGAVALVGDWSNCSQRSLVNLLRAFATEPARLSAMTGRAAAICDGAGVARVLGAIWG